MTLYLKDCKNQAKPICIDFTKYNKINKTLVKACGNKNKLLLDCTAGLCRDAFILLNKKYKVTLIEKNNIIYELIFDAINRGLKIDSLREILEEVDLINIDAIDFLENSKIQYDCIYMDPMFEESKKSRLVKKEMQIFHNLTFNSDNKRLFNLAIKNAKNRVVVKRPINGDYLIENIKPSFSLKEKIIRFDVYIKYPH